MSITFKDSCNYHKKTYFQNETVRALRIPSQNLEWLKYMIWGLRTGNGNYEASAWAH